MLKGKIMKFNFNYSNKSLRKLAEVNKLYDDPESSYNEFIKTLLPHDIIKLMVCIKFNDSKWTSDKFKVILKFLKVNGINLNDGKISLTNIFNNFLYTKMTDESYSSIILKVLKFKDVVEDHKWDSHAISIYLKSIKFRKLSNMDQFIELYRSTFDEYKKSLNYEMTNELLLAHFINKKSEVNKCKYCNSINLKLVSRKFTLLSEYCDLSCRNRDQKPEQLKMLIEYNGEMITYGKLNSINMLKSPESIEKWKKSLSKSSKGINHIKVKNFNSELTYQGSLELNYLKSMSDSGRLNEVKNGPRIQYLYKGSIKHYTIDFIESNSLPVELKSSYYLARTFWVVVAKIKSTLDIYEDIKFILDDKVLMINTSQKDEIDQILLESMMDKHKFYLTKQ
jgi:hypothetical protein